MHGTKKILFMLLAGFLLASSSIAYNWNPSHGGGEPTAVLTLSPATITLNEGESIRFNLSFTTEAGTPILSEVSWKINAAGTMGSLHCDSTTNTSGQLTATYESPADIDIRRYNVTIEAATTWLSDTYRTRARCAVIPDIHETAVTVSASQGSMTAGETVTYTASLRARHDDGWRHLAGQPLTWTFSTAGGTDPRPLATLHTTTNETGSATAPFFLSDCMCLAP